MLMKEKDLKRRGEWKSLYALLLVTKASIKSALNLALRVFQKKTKTENRQKIHTKDRCSTKKTTNNTTLTDKDKNSDITKQQMLKATVMMRYKTAKDPTLYQNPQTSPKISRNKI